MDFVLWKPSDEGLPGWDSPWGRGRPGWHIECSAMADALLGESFDIHGGGNDLMFPHHENEIAQSCCAHPGKGFARIWMHNEMLQVEGKKMSKSLGNFFTVRDLLDQGIPGEVIRFVFLSTHYGKPMDWTARKAEEAKAILHEWRRATHEVEPALVSDELVAALANDLNTPGAIAELHRLAKVGDYRTLLASANLLGLLTDDLTWTHFLRAEGVESRVEVGTPALSQISLAKLSGKLESAREAAKRSKDFTKVDAIKAALISAGVEVRMSKEGVDLVPGPNFDPSKLEDLT
jgi:cysteinyl-tRNA synthetase